MKAVLHNTIYDKQRGTKTFGVLSQQPEMYQIIAPMNKGAVYIGACLITQ